jgi:5-methylcytosine-specific restriction endonuclease McrA
MFFNRQRDEHTCAHTQSVRAARLGHVCADDAHRSVNSEHQLEMVTRAREQAMNDVWTRAFW